MLASQKRSARNAAKREAQRIADAVHTNVIAVESTALVAVVETVEHVESESERIARESVEFAARIATYRLALCASNDARLAYEMQKDASNTNIVKTLADLRASVNHDRIAAVMLYANVNADFLNKSERATARFNVYSAQKLVNIARVCAKVESLNHYTRAILLSAVAFAKASLNMTHRDASAACSLDVATDASRDRLLVRYAKHIAANTAATQSSSSLACLIAFDVLRSATNERNETCFTLNAESEVTKALLASVV